MNKTKKDNAISERLKATQIKYGASAKGDAVFEYFRPQEMNAGAQKSEGFKAPTTFNLGDIIVGENVSISYTNCSNIPSIQILPR